MLPKTGKKRCHIGGYLAAEQKIKSCCQKKKLLCLKQIIVVVWGFQCTVAFLQKFADMTAVRHFVILSMYKIRRFVLYYFASRQATFDGPR